MPRTTPPRPLDVLRAIPELAEHACYATRLHPRRGTPAVADSSIGGPLLWPAQEPWPSCSLAHRVERSERLDPEFAIRYEEAATLRRRRRPLEPAHQDALDDPRVQGRTLSFTSDGVATASWHVFETPDTPNPMVPIAQLNAADIPTVGFPEGKDLLQVLWCPLEHMETVGGRTYCGPIVRILWRSAETIGPVLTDPPRPHSFDEDFYLPQPCILHPEQVTEYQYADLLPTVLRDRVNAADDHWDEAHGLSYQYDLSIAPGCKAGGWASWHVTDPWKLTCAACGSEFDLLLTLDSREWDGIVTWKPVEDDAEDREAQCPTGLTHGRWGAMRIFTCSADPTHPFELDIQ